MGSTGSPEHADCTTRIRHCPSGVIFFLLLILNFHYLYERCVIFSESPSNIVSHQQVNLEYLARVVFEQDQILFPDSLVGTDSHTTMINGLGVVGWGVGGEYCASLII